MAVFWRSSEPLPAPTYRGVYPFRARSSSGGVKWQASYVLDDGSREHLGTYPSEVAAARAFDARARALGHRGRCNFDEPAPVQPGWPSAGLLLRGAPSWPGLPLPQPVAPSPGHGRARTEVPQSRFKGVYFVLGGRWEAKITFRSKSKHIGTFDTEEEAAKAFDARARSLGVPERCNFDADGNEAIDAHGSAFRGVRRSRNKWRAVISVEGQSVNLGLYDTKEQAAEVCRAAEMQNARRKRNAQAAAGQQPGADQLPVPTGAPPA
eukprot:CAMPEP_0119265574 /NCGR_PEP_ID=MMETSP1329-20130426/4356_1 /TAXON_ID=114041 /ORGANISM="Genus nov. species nov., Strain RCC1024" /LENGTH=264 /DNA_ID=CAMNT_0007265415 /DNA_START=312 /DNA_END=1102 /DNA_ORIENTATION=+